MKPDTRKEREIALYEAALRLIARGVNPAAMKVQQIADEAGIGNRLRAQSMNTLPPRKKFCTAWRCTALIRKLPALPRYWSPAPPCRGWRRRCLPTCRTFPAAGWEPIR